MSWLKKRAEEVADAIHDPHDGTYPSDVARVIEEIAREFAERVVRANNSEYEIHRHGTPARLIELTIAAADADETP